MHSCPIDSKKVWIILNKLFSKGHLIAVAVSVFFRRWCLLRSCLYVWNGLLSFSCDLIEHLKPFKNTWSNINTKSSVIFSKPEECEQLKIAHNAQARLCQALNFRWILEENKCVFVFLRKCFSQLKIFMLVGGVSDLVVEVWQKVSNWRRQVRKTMEIMVGVQFVEIENGEI